MAMNIKNFNTGDIIVRTEPGRRQQEQYNENLGVSTMATLYEDTSWIGEPFVLLDIANGMIYLDRVGIPVVLEKKKQLSLQVFAEGWDYFVEPNGYTMQDFENAKVI